MERSGAAAAPAASASHNTTALIDLSCMDPHLEVFSQWRLDIDASRGKASARGRGCFRWAFAAIAADARPELSLEKDDRSDPGADQQQLTHRASTDASTVEIGDEVGHGNVEEVP